MKKGDFAIILSVLIVVFLSFGIIFFKGKSGDKVIISQNNTEIYSGRLHTDKTVTLEGNKIEIKDGKIKMVYASCKNQVCVNHKVISKKGENIICLPNKVIVEIN